MAKGLYDNIHAKRKRIAAGSKETMRKAGAKGAPTAKAFKKAKKTVKKQLDFYFIICYNMQSNYFNNCPYGETVNER